MRWVILTDDAVPGAGGVATWTDAVSRGLAGAGHDVAVFARRRAGLREPYVGVAGPSFGRWGGWWLRLAARRDLARADAVLATTWPVATGLLGVSCPVHVVFHGSDATRRPIAPGAFARVMAMPGRRWAVSRWLADALAARGIVADVLPSPVDPDAPRGREPTGRWGFVGRATPLKGGDRFVRLVREAGARGVVVGDGPELPAWRALAAEIGADVEFLGEVDRARVPEVLRSLDLVVLTPRYDRDGSGGEGLGLALLEAAAVGVPAVGCRTGGVPEAVGPGLLLDDPDDAAASAAAIRRWWTPDRGAEARAWLGANHGVSRVVAALTAR